VQCHGPTAHSARESVLTAILSSMPSEDSAGRATGRLRRMSRSLRTLVSCSCSDTQGGYTGSDRYARAPECGRPRVCLHRTGSENATARPSQTRLHPQRACGVPGGATQPCAIVTYAHWAGQQRGSRRRSSGARRKPHRTPPASVGRDRHDTVPRAALASRRPHQRRCLLCGCGASAQITTTHDQGLPLRIGRLQLLPQEREQVARGINARHGVSWSRTRFNRRNADAKPCTKSATATQSDRL